MDLTFIKSAIAINKIIAESLSQGKLRVIQKSDNLFMLQANLNGTWISINTTEVNINDKLIGRIEVEESVQEEQNVISLPKSTD